MAIQVTNNTANVLLRNYPVFSTMGTAGTNFSTEWNYSVINQSNTIQYNVSEPDGFWPALERKIKDG